MRAPAKNTKLYIAGGFLLALAVLVFAQQAFNLTPLRPSRPDEIFLLSTLSALVFLVLLIFGFVLSRTMVKVWMDRKQQKPGSKFKTSLITTMIALTLIPATVSFLFGFGLINRSILKWFSVPVDTIFTASTQISDQWRRDRQLEVGGLLRSLAGQPLPDLDSYRENLQLNALFLMDASGRPMPRSSDPDNMHATLGAQIARQMEESPELADLYEERDGFLIGARRMDTAQGKAILVAVAPTPKGIAEAIATIANERAHYDILGHNQKPLQDIYLYILVLMSVLVMFAAVWVGLYLSKKITVPIEALAEATREITAGNLDYRVDIQATDELGMLVTLFNDMASQLQGTTRELEARRRYIEVILESIPTGVISVDASFHVNTVNRAARTMFSIEGAAGLEEIFKGKDLDEVQSLLNDAKDGSVTREIEFVTQGRPAHSAVTASHLATGGFVLVVEDLTEVVRAQKASTWREVARRLAHEIKNPLTPIQLSAERIARHVSRLPAATPHLVLVIGECVDAIVGEVSSLKHLVDEFVRFARLPAVERVPNSMIDLVDKTLALYEGRMEGVVITIDIPPDLPPVLMDSLQMKRVLVNLIDNALEALSGEPSKELKIGCELARGGAMARLIIEDNGRGIAPEDRERLFAPYFTTRSNGTGLGLAIASRVVADHGGYIGAEPNAPRGTRFVVELPVCQESLLSTTSPAFGNR